MFQFYVASSALEFSRLSVFLQKPAGAYSEAVFREVDVQKLYVWVFGRCPWGIQKHFLCGYSEAVYVEDQKLSVGLFRNILLVGIQKLFMWELSVWGVQKLSLWVFRIFSCGFRSCLCGYSEAA